jgi:hypothetical protein
MSTCPGEGTLYFLGTDVLGEPECEVFILAGSNQLDEVGEILDIDAVELAYDLSERIGVALGHPRVEHRSGDHDQLFAGKPPAICKPARERAAAARELGVATDVQRERVGDSRREDQRSAHEVGRIATIISPHEPVWLTADGQGHFDRFPSAHHAHGDGFVAAL